MAPDTTRTLFRTEGHFATDPGREWTSGRDDPDPQFVHTLAAHSARAIDHLPRFRARSPLSISTLVRGPWPHVPQWFLKGRSVYADDRCVRPKGPSSIWIRSQDRRSVDHGSSP